ncbi:hypothetical protein M8745_18780, partial [Lutimaribacter sp. EGI FJ00014]|nr:hypothetical protein [Lutimaribacter sp. EGI FJ00014]
AASQTSDCWLGDSLDVVSQNLSMALGAPFSKPFTSFAASRHDLFFFRMLRMQLLSALNKT